MRRTAGFKSGQELEIRVSGGVITIRPKLPNSDDEYTPAQRRTIEAQLEMAEKGPLHAIFESADDMIAQVKGELNRRAATKRRKVALAQQPALLCTIDTFLEGAAARAARRV